VFFILLIPRQVVYLVHLAGQPACHLSYAMSRSSWLRQHQKPSRHVKRMLVAEPLRNCCIAAMAVLRVEWGLRSNLFSSEASPALH